MKPCPLCSKKPRESYNLAITDLACDNLKCDLYNVEIPLKAWNALNNHFDNLGKLLFLLDTYPAFRMCFNET